MTTLRQKCKLVTLTSFALNAIKCGFVKHRNLSVYCRPAFDMASISAKMYLRTAANFAQIHSLFLFLLFAGTSILKITATSMNGQPVAYSRLMQHGDFDHFEIKGDGTIVSGEDSFDYETRPLYRMQFRARESDQLFSTCLVEIKVKDVNDNSPKFPTERYDGRILENSPEGTPVIRVHANDADTGAGGEVRSSLEGTGYSVFAEESHYFAFWLYFLN